MWSQMIMWGGSFLFTSKSSRNMNTDLDFLDTMLKKSKEYLILELREVLLYKSNKHQ